MVGMSLLLFLSGLFFTFSRDVLTQAPKMLGGYVRKADSALDAKDIGRAQYYLQFVNEYEDLLESTPEDQATLERVRARLDEQRGQYAYLVQERDYWTKIDEEYPHYRDAKYMRARAWYGLLEDEKSRELMEEVEYLDPQFRTNN